MAALIGCQAMILMPAMSAVGQDPTIGPQVRIDPTGGTSAANEFSAAADPTNPLRVTAGWNDFRQNAWRCGFSLSFDGGKTWNDFLLRPPPANQSGVEGDPFTAFDDRTGTLWAGGMSFAGNGGIFVARLDPGETEFTPTLMADGGGVDKAWMAAGPMPGNPDSTRLYIAYNLGVIRSDDMGDTWTNPQGLGTGIGFLPRVGPNGEVYIAYWDFGSGVKLKRSLNGGAYTTHTIATRMDVWGTQDGSRFPGAFRVPSINYLDVDMNTGTLYAVYFDTTNIVDGNRNVDLYFTKSTDQGTSWTTPVVINGDNDPPGDQFFSWLEVDDDGRIHIVFLDSRHTIQNDNTFNGMFDAYYTYSDDGGDTWNEFRLTPNSWNSALSSGGNFIGDYLGMAIAGERVYPIYLDTSNGDADTYTNVIVFPSATGDLDGDGMVGLSDLVILLANWGPCADCDDCPADLNDDCAVGMADLLLLLGNWG